MSDTGQGGSLGRMLLDSARVHGDSPALLSAAGNGATSLHSYKDLAATVRQLALGLESLGLVPGDRVALLSGNRIEWLATDLAVLSSGAIDVPRAAGTPPGEAEYVLDHAGASGLVVDTRATLEKLGLSAQALSRLRFVVLFEGRPERPNEHAYGDVLAAGRKSSLPCAAFEERVRALGAETTATIIYTPGTTGRPKGVVLTHGNILHNVSTLPRRMGVGRNDRFLSILPPWHTFERVVEYVLLTVGGQILYASPKTKVLMEALRRLKPTAVAGVPRIWEKMYEAIAEQGSRRKKGRLLLGPALWFERRLLKARRVLEDRLPSLEGNRPWLRSMLRFLSRSELSLLTPVHAIVDREVLAPIRRAFGGALRIRVSGGGSLPPHIDDFFDCIGMPIQEGYGMTETSPVVSVRSPGREVPGTSGQVLDGVEVLIADGAGNPVPSGEKGLIKVRGPNVMQGYYRDSAATESVLGEDGWLVTGDLGRLTPRGNLQICGRAKDTIVLLSGENVEPSPIEQKLRESPLIARALVVGQDARRLGCLLVLDPLVMGQLSRTLSWPRGEADLHRSDWVQGALRQEIDRLVCAETGFKRHEFLSDFRVVPGPFRLGEEITITGKVRRDYVLDKYRMEIRDMNL